MSVRFIAQPVRDQIGTEIIAILRDEEVSTAKFLVAWAKYSGLRRVEQAILAAKQRGLHIEIVVGVDEGGATVQGLEALMPLADKAWVFHNPARPKRTFHPKIYLFEGPLQRIALVGSGNLTSGGLFGNYEAATLVHSERGSESESEQLYIDDVSEYFERIRDDEQSTRELTPRLLAALKADRSIIVGDERSRRTSHLASLRELGAEPTSVFERSLQSLLPIPPLTGGPDAEDGGGDDVVAIGDQVAQIAAAESNAEAGLLADSTEIGGFYKRLSRWDLSHTSSPGQIVIPIRFLEFFEPLNDQSDRTDGAAVQRGRDYIDGVFHDGNFEEAIQARVILYTPAPHHARPNPELRFTLRDRALFDRLEESDYLEFVWDKAGALHVTRTTVEKDSNFGWEGDR